MDNQTSHTALIAAMGDAPVGGAPVSAPVDSTPVAGSHLESIGNRGPPYVGEQLISIKHMRPMIGNPSVSTIYAWMAAGKYPKPVRISENRCAWKMSDIQAWIASKFQTTVEAA